MPVSQYVDLISELHMSHPGIAATLIRAENLRATNIRQYHHGLRLRGLEELHQHLVRLDTSLLAHSEGSKLAGLVRRVRADFETALEAALSGYVYVATDSMRDVMEIELLLHDFRVRPHHLDLWLTGNRDVLRKKFRPAHLRERRAKDLGVHPQQVPERADYQAHSASLHVAPRAAPFGGKGIASSESVFGVDIVFWEMFVHARRLLWALHDLLKLPQFAGLPTTNVDADFPHMKNAYEATQQMQQIFVAMLEASKSAETPDAVAPDET
jgi:hypothetical protein